MRKRTRKLARLWLKPCKIKFYFFHLAGTKKQALDTLSLVNGRAEDPISLDYYVAVISVSPDDLSYTSPIL